MNPRETAKLITREITNLCFEKIKDVDDAPKLKAKIKKLLNDQKLIDAITNEINNIQKQFKAYLLISRILPEEYLKNKYLIKFKNLEKNKEINFDAKSIKKMHLKI